MNWFARKFELSRGGVNDNMRPMEGMRGFAVFLVFLAHYSQAIEGRWPNLAEVHELHRVLQAIGQVGVDLFFILSGYLIYGSLISREQPFLQFMKRRVQRLYPAFTVVFAVYLLLSVVMPSESKIPGPWSAGVVYIVQNYLMLPGLFPIKPMIAVAWSLSYEMFYYLALPVVIVGLNLRRRSTRWRATFFIALTVTFLAYCGVFSGPVRLAMFTAGILLFEVTKRKAFPIPSSGVGLAALVVGLLVTLLPAFGYKVGVLPTSVLWVTFFLLCLACFERPKSWLAQGFAWTPLRWLGNMSYSYYLIHGLAVKVGFVALGVLMPKLDLGVYGLFWWLMPVMFVLSLIPSAALFLLIERPFSLAPKSSSTSRLRVVH
jgi:exopolysaccharide production protein ExoZ